MILKQNIKIYLLIALVAGLFYIPFTGSVHLFDWDEINFAESAREMVLTGDYLSVQINYEPFWEKPPLFIWFQAISMKIFGVSEFAARFPNALCGIITLLILYSIGKNLKDKKFGFLLVLSYGASVLPFVYFKSGIIDPWFNLFIFLGIHKFILFIIQNKTKHIAFSGLWTGLAVLTKGPAGAIIFGLTIFIYLLIKKFKIKISVKQVTLFVLFFIITGGFWFILLIINGDWNVISDFFRYQVRLFTTKDAGHGGFLLYHFVILLIGMFPASVFALNSLVTSNKQPDNINTYVTVMKILFWVVLILFTIVKTKIVHYSSMCYFPLSFLSAVFLYKWSENKLHLNLFTRILTYSILAFYILFAALLPLTGIYKTKIIASGIIKDDFANACLQANINWTGFEALTALLLIIGLIFFILYSNYNKKIPSVVSLYSSVAVFVLVFMKINTEKIEGYSQRAVIDFYKSKQQENCYLATVRFKSYANYFYGNIKKPLNKNYYDDNWLYTGNIDKTTYLVTKNIHRKLLETITSDDIQFLEEKNGFLFYKRTPNLLTND